MNVELAIGDRVVAAQVVGETVTLRKGKVVGVEEGIVMVDFKDGAAATVFSPTEVFPLYRYERDEEGHQIGLIPLFGVGSASYG
jgi:hypothetical protein